MDKSELYLLFAFPNLSSRKSLVTMKAEGNSVLLQNRNVFAACWCFSCCSRTLLPSLLVFVAHSNSVLPAFIQSVSNFPRARLPYLGCEGQQGWLAAG